jgi:hypothetical protein
LFLLSSADVTIVSPFGLSAQVWRLSDDAPRDACDSDVENIVEAAFRIDTGTDLRKGAPA